MLIRLTKISLALLMMLPMFSSTAGIYKWTDSSGEIHYSDKAPAGANTQTLNPVTAVPDGALDARKQLEKREEQFQKDRTKRLEDEAKAEQKVLKEKQRKQACTQLRKNLQTYLTRNRVYEMIDGKPVTIKYEDRLKKMEVLQEQIKETCN